MRIIKYKMPDSDLFEEFVDIGFCFRDETIDNFIFKINNDTSDITDDYQFWFSKFQNYEPGVVLIILNYYFQEFKKDEGKQAFREIYGQIIESIITANFKTIQLIIDKWFHKESNLFKGLDLGWEDVEQLIDSTDANDEGEIIEVNFKDGSAIRFGDSDDYISSLYVPLSEHGTLDKDLDILKKLFSN